MSSTDMTAAAADPTPDGAPFVRVAVDKANGRAVIALDADAIDALLQFVTDLGPGYDLTQNPGSYGVDDAAAHRLADVIGRIAGPLAKLKGHL